MSAALNRMENVAAGATSNAKPTAPMYAPVNRLDRRTLVDVEQSPPTFSSHMTTSTPSAAARATAGRPVASFAVDNRHRAPPTRSAAGRMSIARTHASGSQASTSPKSEPQTVTSPRVARTAPSRSTSPHTNTSPSCSTRSPARTVREITSAGARGGVEAARARHRGDARARVPEATRAAAARIRHTVALGVTSRAVSSRRAPPRARRSLALALAALCVAFVARRARAPRAMGAGTSTKDGGVDIDVVAPKRVVSYARASGDAATKCERVLEDLRAGALDDATELDVSNCGLTELPDAVGRLTRLEFLNAGGNALRTLPESIENCRKLKRAFFLGNAFERVPEVLGRLPELFMVSFKACAVREVSEDALAPSLGWLILSDNQIERLPASLGRCAPMRKLMLAGNKLRALPESMRELKNLELLRLADNRFETFPSWILESPRLSWFAAAANPATDTIGDKAKTRANSADVVTVDWSELGVAEDAEPLGKGASGAVYAGRWNGETVAVKVYNNAAKTSDGRPEDEMTASVLAATIKSEGTIKTIARFQRGDSRGLVMQYLDHASWKDLGKPPSFDTVARDTYDDDVRFTAKEIMAVARDVGSALRELHALGVVHGDVYAHNILHVKESPGIEPRAKLGDFGAAWFYERDSSNARTIELNEARAFGAVLEEVCARHDGVDGVHPIAALAALAAGLLGERGGRLLFDDIVQRIAAIQLD